MKHIRIILLTALALTSQVSNATPDACTQTLDRALTEEANLVTFLHQRIEEVTLINDKNIDDQKKSLLSIIALRESMHKTWAGQRENEPDCKVLKQNAPLQNRAKGFVYAPKT